MRITNFEFGSIKIEKNKAVIQIPKSKFKYENLSELEEVKSEQNNFLKLLDIKESDNKERVIFKYDIPEEFKSLQSIKKEDLIVKLSILKTILEMDPLNETDLYISMNPSTIFYRPMKAVKFSYRANYLMPNETKFSNFERYKALTLSIVSGLSYEICLNNSDRVRKSKDKLILSLLETNNINELLTDLDNQLDYIQYTYFEVKKQNIKKSRFKKVAISLGLIMLILVSVGLTKSLSNKQHSMTVSTYENKIELQEQKFKIASYIEDEEYEKAAKEMKNSGKNKKEIADMYINAEEYQKALDVDPESLEKVLGSLYNKDKEDDILNLELADSKTLDIEKAIVSYDTEVLDNQINFIQDDKQAVRMGKKFVQRNDLDDAEKVLSKFNDKELENQINIKKKENELDKQKKNLEKIQKDKSKEKDKDKKKDKEKQEKSTSDKIKSLEGEIAKLKGD